RVALRPGGEEHLLVHPLRRRLAVALFHLDTDGAAARVFRGPERAARTHERVEDELAFGGVGRQERQEGAHRLLVGMERLLLPRPLDGVAYRGLGLRRTALGQEVGGLVLGAGEAAEPPNALDEGQVADGPEAETL